jgi:hypothetical protein
MRTIYNYFPPKMKTSTNTWITTWYFYMSNCKGLCLYSVSEYCSDFHIVLVPNNCSVLWYKQIVGYYKSTAPAIMRIIYNYFPLKMKTSTNTWITTCCWNDLFTDAKQALNKLSPFLLVLQIWTSVCYLHEEKGR